MHQTRAIYKTTTGRQLQFRKLHSFKEIDKIIFQIIQSKIPNAREKDITGFVSNNKYQGKLNKQEIKIRQHKIVKFS